MISIFRIIFAPSGIAPPWRAAASQSGPTYCGSQISVSQEMIRIFIIISVSSSAALPWSAAASQSGPTYHGSQISISERKYKNIYN